MRATFENTVDILVKAYLKGTLHHSHCHACAVGNIINYHEPFSASDVEELRTHKEGWVKVFCTFFGIDQNISPSQYKGKAKKQIDSTGYSWQELAKIEFAFETASRGNSMDEWMFNGLMAVVNVLAEIHNVDLSVRESAKQLFVKA